MKYSTQDIAQLGTILAVWAHPDDEAWTMAGVMAAARQNGQRVVVITATRGEAGKTADESRWPQADLRNIRTQELEASLAALGVIEHHWLNYTDGKLKEANADQAIEQIAEVIRAVDPNTIFSFAKDGLTGHDDHKTISRWTLGAAQLSGSPARLFGAVESTEKYKVVCADCPAVVKDIYFNAAQPYTVPLAKVSLCFELTKYLQELKTKALQQQDSQTAQLFETPDGQAFIKQQIACECFIDLVSSESI